MNMQKQKNKNKTTEKKRNVAVYIDGENIPAKKAKVIMSLAEGKGVIDYTKVYARQKDPCTRNWTTAAKNNHLKEIRIAGQPEKNKVDRKLQKDIVKDIQKSKNIDIVCIVSSDHGYAETASQVRAMGKRVIIIGESKAPDRLQKSGNEFVRI